MSDHNQTIDHFIPRSTGHSVGTWANMLLIVALSVIFGSLLFSYYMTQHESPSWPPDGQEHPPIAIALIATLLLLSSIAPLGMSYLAIQRDRIRPVALSLGSALSLGWTYFVVQAVGYAHLDLRPIDSVYSALIVALGGFHLIVTLIGLVVLGVVTARSLLRHFDSTRYLAIETALCLWLFVVVSGVLTFGTIYLNPYF